MCIHYNCLDEAIVVSTYNIQFQDKIIKKKCSLLELSEEFRKDSKTDSN